LTFSGPRGHHLIALGEPAQIAGLLDERGLSPVEPELAEVLRIRLLLPRAPNELNDGFTPYDVGLTDLISFNKGCYVGQEVIARLSTYGKVRRGLAVVSFPEKLSLSVPATLANAAGEALGEITSLAEDQRLGRTFGLAVVKLDGFLETDKVRVVTNPQTATVGRIASFSNEQHRP